MSVDAAPVDVTIVGGSYAGLSAALQLARARRSVVVVDSGARRNRFADTSHGFLSRDGEAPAVIAAHGREQLMAYPNVRFVEGMADTVSRGGANLIVSIQGEKIAARRLILATGVIDELPSLPGLQERWGRAVFHCPYCHGYELGQGRIGVLATGENSFHQAMMLPDWGPTTLFANDVFEPDAAQAAMLEARGVEIERQKVVALDGPKATLVLEGGRTVSLEGLFVASRTRMASGLPAALGCAFEEGPLGPFIRTNEAKETSVEGVYACGDAARSAGSVSHAVGDGVTAAVAAHKSLIFDVH
ncbi:FAD-binding protein [Sinorhizobium medicae]|uniref:Thioredoxin reductase n=2 Tax=Sinorhizobium medicae TaxID=110321 RepID=A0A508WNH2_9HYPH|nr:NAD(P)/FAD-dependent oxidoreductase [Sinorhizobium medicae]ABR62383.1 FAD-dependent pyridine nucleotide-disulphide oxidoreductase [Sinorhizobium medicae WSM419]MBO1940739.1 NAD(P)/FAD-dependent oxidoreductase [Sinorhizobium medicae]MBO1963982.1 NAD(P)/FAD-dependent oxidoreductase [Sinorhizobium medicae]MDX0407251.1 FAD-binding protein [Sinorhizobium medicae]MDX0412796.1 FAD-binding protein [Sinorhizobium medicae]